MDMNNSPPIRWNPCFSPVFLSRRDLLLAGETDSYIIEGEEYGGLPVLVDGTTSVEEIVLRAGGFGNQSRLMYSIRQFLDNGILTYAGKNKNRYVHPDYTASPRIYTLDSGNITLYDFSAQDIPRHFFRQEGQWAGGTPVSIVLTDDYLDPRLENMDAEHRKQKKPWMLMKLTGRQPLIGPWFLPEDRNTPCYECLATRLFHNQPVRRWLCKGNRKNIRPLPILYDEEQIKRTAAYAMEKALEVIKYSSTGILWVVNLKDSLLTPHVFVKRPQCPVCGDPELVRNQSGRHPELTPSVKAQMHDGGSRTVPPEQTVQKVLPFISPLTGIIHEIREVPDQGKSVITIYRTSFYKTPFEQTLPSNNDFVKISLGKGVSKAQSRASALCESVERFAVQYQGDELSVFEKACNLDKRVIEPNRLVFFTPEQYHQFKDPGYGKIWPGTCAKEYNREEKIHWTLCFSLTKEELCYVPFTYCYSNTPWDKNAQAPFNTNGCAAGNTKEEAILQGFFELIERDATGVWWYNKLLRPRVDIRGLDRADQITIRQTLEPDWEYWVLDLTHDFRIPVMAGVARSKKTGELRFGFGCHLNARIACTRALTELYQLIAINYKGTRIFDFTKIPPDPYLFPGGDTGPVSLSSFPETEQDDMLKDIRYCVRRAKELGYEVLVHNSSRPDLPVKTLKVIVPGLCHIWPQLGNPRLYEVPVTMKWVEKRLSTDQLNTMNLFI